MSQSHKCPVVQRWHSYLEDLSLANYFESWLWYLAAKKKKSHHAPTMLLCRSSLVPLPLNQGWL